MNNKEIQDQNEVYNYEMPMDSPVAGYGDPGWMIPFWWLYVAVLIFVTLAMICLNRHNFLLMICPPKDTRNSYSEFPTVYILPPPSYNETMGLPGTPIGATNNEFNLPNKIHLNIDQNSDAAVDPNIGRERARFVRDPPTSIWVG